MFRYLFSSGLKQIKADWQEYKNLRKLCKDAAYQVRVARNKLVHFCELEEVPKTGIACIVAKEIFPEHPDDWEDAMPYVANYYCRYFYPSYHEMPCQKKECPYYEKNNQYAKLVSKYMDLELKKVNFWHNKFMREK